MHRAMNSKLAGLGIAALALASGAAQAELSSTVTIASDYDFRGVTQTALDPAFQASLDWSGESGVYVGLWGSNIDFGTYIPSNPYIPPPGVDPGPEEQDIDLNVEVDAILGYAGSFTDDLGYDIGATYYKYLGGGNNGENDFDYTEVYTGISYKLLSTKIWYTWDYGNSGDGAWYGEANGDIPLPWWDLGVALHAGYSGGNYWDDDENGLSEFYDFSVGITRSFGHFDFAVKYIDGSDLEESDCSRSAVDCGPDPVFSSESKFFVSIATTFPWTKEE